MKKIIKKSIAGTEEMKLSETASCEDCKCSKIDKLAITFNSEDLNKVVEKINEIIESKCQ